MISQAHLDRITELLGQSPLGEGVVASLRAHFDDIHFTYCMDDDVYAAAPVYESATYNLYLVDSRNHCLSFTQDMALATGIVVAEVAADAGA